MDIKKKDLEEVWLTMRVADIAAKFSTTQQAVYYWARKYELASRAYAAVQQASPKDPTIDEIRERAAEVRKKWTSEERARRVVGARKANLPGIRCYSSEQLFGQSEAAAYARI